MIDAVLLLYSVIIISDEGSIIGMSVGSFFGLCVIFVGLIFIIVGALLYYRRRRAQYDGKTSAIVILLNHIIAVFVST